MNDSERREQLYKLYIISSEHLISLGFMNCTDIRSSLNDIGAKLKVSNLSNINKKCLINGLHKESISNIEKYPFDVLSKKDVDSNGEKRLKNGNSVMSEAAHAKEDTHPSSRKASKFHASSECLMTKKKKRILHPDIEPDDDDDNIISKDCHCINCNGKVFDKNILTVRTKCNEVGGEVFHNNPSKQSKSYKPVHRISNKRKRNDDDYDLRKNNKIRLDSINSFSMFKPNACSTPLLKNSDGISQQKISAPLSMFMMKNCTSIQSDELVNFDKKTSRIIKIEDLSQEDINSNLHFSKNDASFLIDDTFNGDYKNESTMKEFSLNRTFVLSPTKGTSSSMFSTFSQSPDSIVIPLPNISPPPDATNTTQAMPQTSSSEAQTIGNVLEFEDASLMSTSCKDGSSILEKSVLSPTKQSCEVSEDLDLKSIELMGWSVIQNDLSFQLSGYIYDFGTKKCKKYTTHPVKKIHKTNLIETTDGKIYKLMNKFTKSRSNISTYAFQHFKNGFPHNWKDFLNKSIKKSPGNANGEVTPGKISRKLENMKITKKCVMKKHSLNSSFFDLPEGKGTSESPVTRNDLRQTRKSGRLVVPPLAYWKNQRILVDPRTHKTIIEEGTRNMLNTKVICFDVD